MSYATFLDRVSRKLATDQILDQPSATTRYGVCTTGVKRRIAGAVRPVSQEQVRFVVLASRELNIPLYPVSTGNNWGYGSANPVTDDCVIVDLSGMTGIVLNNDLGLATIEPGVTQHMLRQYLDDHGLRFLCPVTGGGPNCSILGNALERGYGITPYTDHFLAVMSLEAVLPDGAIYRSPLTELGCSTIDHAFKWGVGPYVDGIFSQGAFGIVTQMTIALAPIPEQVEAFFFGLRQESDLEQAVTTIQASLRQVGGMLGSINLLNTHRVLAMTEPYPRDQLDQNGLIKQSHVLKMAHRNRISPWMGTGAIYGPTRVVRAAKAVIKETISDIAQRLVFFTPQSIRRYHQISQHLPGKSVHNLQNMLATLDKTLQIFSGTPSEIALPLAYWISGNKPKEGTAMNPARDGCGLLWYSPLVPMQPDTVRKYTDMVCSVCTRHGFEPLITLTTLSDRCFDSTVPILFDSTSETATERARQCYEALILAGQAIGCYPYRSRVDSMHCFIRPDAPYWQIVATLKKALDPAGLISPGRYSPPTLTELGQ